MFMSIHKNIVLILVSIVMSMNVSNAQHSRAIGLYLDSFTKFFLWPNEPKEHLVIGIYGETDVYPYLHKIYTSKKGKKVRNMVIILKNISEINEATTCDMIFVTKENNAFLEKMSSVISGRPILLVTCVPGFNSSAAVNIDINNNYHIEISSANIRGQGIKISSSLTNMAEEI